MKVRIENVKANGGLDFSYRPDFSYRHEWQEGDLVIWNNCGEIHRVVPCDEYCGRTMHRTMIMSTERLGGPLAVQLQ